MSDEKITAEQAWAEYDAAAAATEITGAALQKADREDNVARRRFYKAERAAYAIGPRPIKVPS